MVEVNITDIILLRKACSFEKQYYYIYNIELYSEP